MRIFFSLAEHACHGTPYAAEPDNCVKGNGHATHICSNGERKELWHGEGISPGDREFFDI